MLVSKEDDLCLWAESSIGHNKPSTRNVQSRPPASFWWINAS